MSEDCDKMIDDKYVLCVACVSKREKANKQFGGVATPQQAPSISFDSREIVNAISQVNNNLYALRTQFDVLLKETTGKAIIWDPETKRFIETDNPNMLRSQNYVLWILLEELLKERGKAVTWNNLEKRYEIQEVKKGKAKK
jgi:hypothetical protein